MKSAIMYETKIMSEFPCATDYGEYVGYDDEESRALEDWLNDNHSQAVDRYGDKAQVLYEYGDTEEFAMCDVLRQHGTCVEVKVVVVY